MEGSLIELGSEEYHAELVHDDAAETVTIYLLDSAAKEVVPIDATEIISQSQATRDKQSNLELLHHRILQITAGKSSRFVSTDAELAEELRP